MKNTHFYQKLSKNCPTADLYLSQSPKNLNHHQKIRTSPRYGLFALVISWLRSLKLQKPPLNIFICIIIALWEKFQTSFVKGHRQGSKWLQTTLFLGPVHTGTQLFRSLSFHSKSGTIRLCGQTGMLWITAFYSKEWYGEKVVQKVERYALRSSVDRRWSAELV